MRSKSSKSSKFTRIATGGTVKRGGRGRTSISFNVSKRQEDRERLRTRKMVGKMIENMADALESIGWNKNGFTPVGQRRIAELATSLPLYEAAVDTRHGSLSPLVISLDGLDVIQVDRVALNLYIADLRKYMDILPIADMIEVLGGCTGTLPVYQHAAEVGRVAELLGDRVPPETQRQVRRIVTWVKRRTPAFVSRLVDMYYERASFNAKYRLNIHGTAKRRACRMSNASRGTDAAGRRTVKARR